jgi:hypothetical protein
MATALAQSAPPTQDDFRRELEDRYRQACELWPKDRGTVRLLSKPDAQTERYELRHEVPIGKAIELPEPWNLTLETGRLVD